MKKMNRAPKRAKILAMTGAALMAAASSAPLTAYAASAGIRLPGLGQGSGRPLVIGKLVNGSLADGACSLEEILGQLGQLMGQGDCEERPGGGRPGTGLPGNPGDRPGTGLPGNPGGQPDAGLPGNPEDQPDAELPETPDQEGSEEQSFVRQVVQLVNEERAKNGLAPLTVHTGAEQAAAVRAKEIQTSFSHTRPDGSGFSTALTQAGVSYTTSGENIAYGQQTPQAVMEAWMNSAGHRANILNASFRQIGVGHVRSASGVSYWTQLFIN